MEPSEPAPWWQRAVVYQVYPRSFADASGDGVGDLEGIRHHLDHLAWLGVDALWLSPFYRSPMADFGYDVSEHCDVDPVFGTLADFDRLLADAHCRDIRVLVDWVANHTSDQHPWFRQSASSRQDPRRNWYVWRDTGSGGGPPNNWRSAFTGETAWTFHPPTGQWYLHLFLPSQPDLNWAEPAVVEAMHGVLRFWLDRGVDGFRADAVHAIGKDPRLPDDPPELAGTPKSSTNDHPLTHARLRDIRRLVDAYPGDRAMVGEVYLLDTAKVATYYGRGDELHLAFNFPPLYAPWEARAWQGHLEDASRHFGRHWPTWVLSNHDNPRARSRYGTEGRARAAAVLLLGLRGTPFLYAGEELGLEDAAVGPDKALDPGGRDGCRAPMPWNPRPGHGWPTPPWLPWPPDAAELSVEAQRERPSSVLQLYRRLIAARRASPALTTGAQRPLDAPEEVLAWERAAGEDRRRVVVSFSAQRHELDPDGAWSVEVASDGVGEGEPWTGRLGPDQAVLLRPALPAGTPI